MFLPSNITLKLGDSGDFVSELQRRLSLVKCFNADAINGFFDGNTVSGVSQFQTMSGIRADGIAGPETLRRLNGSISGDNSSTEDHKAEEEAKRQQEQQALLLQQQLYEQEQKRLANEQLAAQQQAAALAAQQPAAPAIEAPQPQQQAQTAAPAAVAPPAVQPAPLQPAPQASLMDLFAQAAPPLATQQPTPPPMPASPQVAPVAAELAQPAAAAPKEQAATAQVPAAPEQQPKGIVGRAVQYANEMVQKLANYFEAKLPAHVIQEVKSIGHVMASSGMKEVAIPAGPEQQRGPETPSRGTQQPAQVPQRN